MTLFLSWLSAVGSSRRFLFGCSSGYSFRRSSQRAADVGHPCLLCPGVGRSSIDDDGVFEIYPRPLLSVKTVCLSSRICNADDDGAFAHTSAPGWPDFYLVESTTLYLWACSRLYFLGSLSLALRHLVPASPRLSGDLLPGTCVYAHVPEQGNRNSFALTQQGQPEMLGAHITVAQTAAFQNAAFPGLLLVDVPASRRPDGSLHPKWHGYAHTR